jgi:cytochrome P450
LYGLARGLLLCQDRRCRQQRKAAEWLPAPIEYDPFSDTAMRDPHPLYRWLRANAPAYRLEQYDGWAVSRFQDVWDAFLDREHFTESEGQVFPQQVVSVSHHGAQPPRAATNPLSMFNLLDPPVQTQLRRIMAGPLHPAAIARLEPFIRDLTRRTLDRLLAQGGFDVNADFGSTISCSAISHVIGLPVADVPAMVRLVNRINAREPGRSGMTEEGWAAVAELSEFTTDCVRRRRAGEITTPRPLIDCLLVCEIEGRKLTDTEIRNQLVSILIGGTESLPKIIAGGWLELWRHPDQRAYVAADPARCPAAVEEMIRFHAPAQWFGRTLIADVELAGTRMWTGQRVFMLVASANRDEREFEDPDSFRCDRKMRRVVAFGLGPHFCSGVFLARLEARIMLEEFLARVPDYEIDLDRAERSVSEFQIGWTAMPLTVTNARRSAA